ncbi:hypothetical protein C2G38_2035592 [Gigaspora rosea]|uniref:Uncharacterized protein n=1 Tax=Gigaspora rosea TaxID=44941 RepID=A0A397VC13_9GLOM|nr:hypothetical protein C2G38_2035592 [Gigaspora rosea]
MSNDISAVNESSKNLSQYFIHRKSMDQARKINNIISDHTDDKSIAEQWLKEPTPIPKFPKVDTEIIPKVSDEIDISKANNNIPQEIPKVTSFLAQPEKHALSLIESNPQMRPSLEALTLSIGGIGAIPVVASSLMSPLLEYIFLILLIIAVIWFVILRHT